MPSKPLRPCKQIGCKELSKNTYCELHTKHYDTKRGNSAERGYGAKWRKYRITFLSLNPFCVRCLEKNIHTLATVVDHIKPHKGNMTLFWDSNNHQGLCKGCHDTKTVKEDGGFGRPMR